MEQNQFNVMIQISLWFTDNISHAEIYWIYVQILKYYHVLVVNDFIWTRCVFW